VHQESGVVTLTGWVEDTMSEQSVIRAARKGEGITNVVSHIRLVR